VPCTLKSANDPIFAPSFLSDTPFTYAWDAANRLAQVRIPGESAIVWNTYTWTAPAKITYPGGSTRQITHNPLLRIRRITTADPAGNPVQDYQYRYDPVGNLLEKATEHGTYAYEYDPRDCLTRAANPTLPNEAWTYDPASNSTRDASLPGPWTYDDANANALKAYANVTLQHDANGSTTQKTVAGQTTSYLYDLENRLTEVKDPTGATLATYGYDPFGRRIWKETGGTRTYFVYSEEGLVAELDATGNVIQSYGYIPQSTYGTAPLYTRTTIGYAYYQLDHLGTPQVLTDKSGKIVWQGRAKAFGETTEIVNLIANPLRFPGQYEDRETGMHYNYFRYYDPLTGRYITSDPIGLLGGLNVYIYASQNPGTYMGMFGLHCKITIWVFGSKDDWGYKAILEYYDDQTGEYLMIEDVSTWPNPNSWNPGIAAGKYKGVYNSNGFRRRDGTTMPYILINKGDPVDTIDFNPNYPGRGNLEENGLKKKADRKHIHCSGAHARATEGCIGIRKSKCQRLWDKLDENEECDIEIIR